MKIKLPETLKMNLDDAAYESVKDLVKKGYSKIEETENGFIYIVDFEKEP